MKKLLVLLAFVVSPALAEVPVKDRCGAPDTLKTLLQIMDRDVWYPSKFAEGGGAFTFDPDTVLTTAYDDNLDKVTCSAQFIINVEFVDPKKRPWAELVLKKGIKTINKTIVYDMQYVSGNKTRFNVGIDKIADRTQAQ